MRASLLLVVLFFNSGLIAAELPLVPGQASSDLLGEYISFNRAFSADAVLEGLGEAEFQQLEQSVANFGIEQGPIWLRITVSNTSDVSSSWILSLNRTLLDQLKIVMESAGQYAVIMNLDNRLASYERFGTLAVPFGLQGAQSATLFILYEGPNSSVLPISIESPESMASGQLFKLILFFCSLAAVSTLVVYNTVLGLITRMRAFLFYGAAQIVLFSYFTHLSGITTIYMWPETPEIGNMLAPILAILTCLFTILFSKTFIKEEYLTRWVSIVFQAVIYVSLAYLALSALGLALSITIPLLSIIATGVTTATVIILPVCGIMASSNRRYRYLPMAIAWLWFSVSMSYTTLSLLNLVPVTPSFLEMYMVFAFIEAILLSVSLALTVRHIERERVSTQESLAISLTAELEESRRAEKLALERSMALDDLADRGRLLQAAGHDTRQALFALRQFAAGLGPDVDPERIQTARQSISQLVNHLDDVLATTLAGAHGGAMIDQVLALENVRVGDLLEPIRLIYQRMASQKGLRLITHAGEFSFVTDRVLMIRVLSNLVSNAIKYTDSGGVLVGCRRFGESIRLQVWDTGNGLSDEQIALLMEENPHAHRFEQFKEGLGSGFQISRVLAENLGAELKVSSALNKGSLFECVIPRTSALYSSCPSCYVLDDDPLMKEWIARTGIRIEESIPEQSDLPLFIDYDYQGSGNGLNLAKEMNGSFPNLVLTSFDHAADVRNAAAGVVSFIAYKPLEPATVWALVSRMKLGL